MSRVHSAPSDEGEELFSSPQDVARLQILGGIAEEYHACVAADRTFDVTPHLAAHPEFAEEIRALVNTLNVLGESTSVEAALHSPTPVVGREFAGFRILREIARGGMGVVYEAQQVALQRRVALKVLSFTHSLSAQQLRRFTNEATIAAQLRHPNIVSVYSIGRERDMHFYVMEFIDGASLADVIRFAAGESDQAGDHQPTVIETDSTQQAPVLEPEDAVEFGAQAVSVSDRLNDMTWIRERLAERYRWCADVIATVAHALEHAHQGGVIHRDVKPSNLLFDRHGKVYLADFGVAQNLEASAVTRTGDIVGTLRYMSPEQTAGKRGIVDVRSDVYSLGITLYEAVTGQPAFPDSVPANLLAHVMHKEPAPVRRIRPDVPADLETIILKATAKSPQDRYDSAQSFAEDLERFLAGRPILARRLSLFETAARWTWYHRRPVLVASLGAMLVSLLLAASAVQAYLSKKQAETALADLKVIAEDAAQAARREERERHRAELLLYVADMQSAGAAARDGDVGRLASLLGRYVDTTGNRDPRGFEWWMLRDVWSLPATTVATNETALYCVRFSPDGTRFAVAGADATVRLFDASARQLQRSWPTGQQEVNQVAFDASGTRLATAGDDGSVRLWDLDSGRELRRFAAHESQCFGVALSPDGERLFSCGADRRILAWSLNDDDSTGLLLGTHGRAVEGIALSTDGRWLISAGADNVARVWDTHSMQPVLSVAPQNDAAVNVVTVSPSGRIALGTKGGKLIVLSARDADRIWYGQHFDDICGLAFGANEQTLISGDGSGVIRLWELPPAEPSTSSELAGKPLPLALVSQNHLRLISDDELTDALLSPRTVERLQSGELRVVRTQPLHLLSNAKRHTGRVFSISAGADTTRFLSAGEDGQLIEWQLRDADHITLSRPEPRQPLRMTSLPGERIAWIVDEHTVEIRNTTDGTVIDTLVVGMNRAYCMAASPTGRLLAVGGAGPSVELWDLASQRFVRRIDVNATGDVSQIAFAPDGQSIAVLCWNSVRSIAGPEGTVRLYDVSSGMLRAEQAAADCKAMGFAPAGPAADTFVYVDAHDLILQRPGERPQRIASTHQSAINGLVFSPRGTHFATMSDDRTAKLWAADGERLSTMIGHRDHVQTASFHPDGRTLVTGSVDGEVRLWNVASGQPLFLLRRFDVPVRQLEFTASGSRLACLLDDGTLHLLSTGRPTRQD